MNELIRALITMTATASAVIAILFIIKPIIKDRLPKAFQYYIWLIVAVLLLVPINIRLPAAAQYGADGQPAGAPLATIRDVVDRYVAAGEPAPLTNAGGSAPEQAAAGTGGAPSLWPVAVVALWALGAAIFLLVNLIGYFRFCAALKKETAPARPTDTELLSSLCAGRQPRLYRSKAAATPMLIGLARPYIVLPDREYEPAQLRHILSHELTHLRRRDIAVKWIMTMANAVHWFNPLVYLARREAGRACELSCDEAVISSLDSAGKQGYGDALISVAAENRLPAHVLSTTMCEQKKTIKERLVSIMKYKSKSKGSVVLSVALAVALSASALALCASVTQGAPGNASLMDAAGYTQEALETIEANATPFVGDNAKVGAIVGALPISWKGLEYKGFSLQTQSEPYELTIQYDAGDLSQITDYLENPFAASIRENNALLLFAAIDNLSVVNEQNPKDMVQYSFTREQIAARFGGIPSISETGRVRELISGNFFLDEFYFAHASRLWLGDATTEYVMYRYGEPPTESMELENGLTLYLYPGVSYYFKDDTLFATRMHASNGLGQTEIGESAYSDITAKFGEPHAKREIDGKLYISYELRSQAEGARAFFLFEAGVLIEQGVITGDDYQALLDGGNIS